MTTVPHPKIECFFNVYSDTGVYLGAITRMFSCTYTFLAEAGQPLFDNEIAWISEKVFSLNSEAA